VLDQGGGADLDGDLVGADAAQRDVAHAGQGAEVVADLAGRLFEVLLVASPKMESEIAGRLGSILVTTIRSAASGRSWSASTSRFTSATASSIETPSSNSIMTRCRPR
jgi:hypothetical protein